MGDRLEQGAGLRTLKSLKVAACGGFVEVAASPLVEGRGGWGDLQAQMDTIVLFVPWEGWGDRLE